MAGEVYDEKGNLVSGPPAPPPGQPSFVPTGPAGTPTLGGYAKSLVFPDQPPQASVPMAEVPGIVARLPGAAVSGAQTAVSGPPRKPGDDAEDIISPGTPGEMRGHEDTLDAIKAEMQMDMGLLGGNVKPPPRFYQDAHEDYSPVGGRRGKEMFQRAYGDGPDDGPAKLEGAIRESGAAQTQKNEAMAKFYDGEAQRATSAAATRKMAMEQDAAEMRMRQERMEKATQFYTDDLNNRGAFWSKPENIVAAISFSLMPIFSSDPTVGVKLVNQAIQQDLEHRRQTAGMALGALRSNMDGYHKIVGDRQAGDQLAEAEARRIAALEVERIGAKFESPISKAKMEAIAQDLRIKASQGYMQAYNQAKVFSPATVTDPELFKHRTQGYDGAWSSLNVKDVAPIQTVGAAANGSVGKGSPSLAVGTGKGGGFTDHVSPEIKGMIRGGAPAEVAAQVAMNGRIPGSANMFNALSIYVNRFAAAKAGGLQYGPAFEKAKADVIQDAKKELAAVPGLSFGKDGFAGRKATTQNLIASAQAIEASETANGRDPGKFLGVMRPLLGAGFSQKYEEITRAFESKGSTPAQARTQARDWAVASFRQRMQQELAKSYSDISGGAITDTELARLRAFISDGSDFNFVHNWLKEKSVEIQAKERTALVGSSAMAQLYYMTRTGVGQRNFGLPVRAEPGPARPPEGKGEFNVDPSTISTPAGGQSMASGVTRYGR